MRPAIAYVIVFCLFCMLGCGRHKSTEPKCAIAAAVPPQVIKEAQKRIGDLKPGMTVDEVFRALGLERYRDACLCVGNGPTTTYFEAFYLDHQHSLTLVIDYSRDDQRGSLIEAAIVDNSTNSLRRASQPH